MATFAPGVSLQEVAEVNELKPFVDEDALRELRNIAMEIEQRIARVDRARQLPPPPLP